MLTATAPYRERSRKQPPKPFCATPGCSNPSGHGDTKRFCPHCSETLKAIRDELQLDAKRTHEQGSRINNGRFRGGPPICSIVSCSNPRTPPNAYCSQCLGEMELMGEAA